MIFGRDSPFPGWSLWPDRARNDYRLQRLTGSKEVDAKILGDERVGGVGTGGSGGEALPLAAITTRGANGCPTITQCQPQQ
jgi:hypothetical protein